MSESHGQQGVLGNVFSLHHAGMLRHKGAREYIYICIDIRVVGVVSCGICG